MKIELQQAYLLSSRPYLESSLLVDIFTRDYGRISMVARGAKRGKFSKFALLQPFIPLLVSWQGSGTLYTMTHVEMYNSPNLLLGRKLISGMYLNELLVRLIASNDSHVDLFDCYQRTIKDLGSNDDEQVFLRLFEKKMLMAIGYELPLIQDVLTGELVLEHYYYTFNLEQGPQKANQNNHATNTFKGSSLLALHTEKFNTKEDLQDAKKILRFALAWRLGEQPLHSRKLLRGTA